MTGKPGYDAAGNTTTMPQPNSPATLTRPFLTPGTASYLARTSGPGASQVLVERRTNTTLDFRTGSQYVCEWHAFRWRRLLLQFCAQVGTRFRCG